MPTWDAVEPQEVADHATEIRRKLVVIGVPLDCPPTPPATPPATAPAPATAASRSTAQFPSNGGNIHRLTDK
jgi:hypothetical protein